MLPVPEPTTAAMTSVPPARETSRHRPTPHLVCVGMSHRSATADFRERAALSPALQESLRQRCVENSSVREHVILATCNRTEVYAVVTGEETEEVLTEIVSETLVLEPALVRQNSYHLRGEAAVQHLFAVSAGLDSQIVGETEILGQVKDAYEGSRVAKSAGPMLNFLFQKAFQAGKLVRTKTAVTQGHVTTGSVAVELARRVFGDLSKAKVLLLGTGEVGQDLLAALQARGLDGVTVGSQDPGRAVLLAESFGGTGMPREEALRRLPEYDIVIAATRSTAVLIAEEAIKGARGKRKGRPLFLLDLGHPRNIASGAGSLANVFLYNLADLSRIANENLATRETELEQAQSLLAERSKELWQRWWTQILRYYRSS